MNEEVVRRIAVVGPVRPFRSGIAEHTTMLCQALAGCSEVLVLSFSRQYPAFLFPGESDRDPTAAPLDDPKALFCIDSLNPLSWWRAVRRIAEFEPDLVILPWWTVLFAACTGYLARALRRRGFEVRFLCHNVFDHEAARWKIALSRSVLRQGNSFVAHSRAVESEIRKMVPGARTLVSPLPVFTGFPEPTRVLERRAPLELLFFGIVRPYKGVDLLVEAISGLPRGTAHLTIAGEFWAGRAELEATIEGYGLEACVELLPQYVTAEEAANLFQRADVVVLPYRGATGSGVLGIAYRYGKPVLATRVGSFPEVVHEGETGFLVAPDSPDALLHALEELSAERAAAMRPAVERAAAALTWAVLADAIVSMP